jgi:hypothetical protein
MRIIGKRSVASGLKLWLDILYVIVVIAGVAFVGLGAYYLIAPDPEGFEVDAPVSLRLDGSAFRITSAKLGVEQSIIDDVTGMVRFNVPLRPLIVMYLALGTVMAAVVVFVLLCLRRIFASLVAGYPFTLDNARRIRWIAVIVLCGEVAVKLVEFFTQRYIRSNFEAEGLTLNADFALDLSTIFVGLVLLVLSELFRIGSELQREKELTV